MNKRAFPQVMNARLFTRATIVFNPLWLPGDRQPHQLTVFHYQFEALDIRSLRIFFPLFSEKILKQHRALIHAHARRYVAVVI